MMIGDNISRLIVQEEITKSIALKENPHQMYERIQAIPSVTPQPKKNETDAKYAMINLMLFNYYENKREKRLRNAIRSIDCDPYMDIIVFYYRDRMTIEQIAESYKVDTSTIVRNKRRLCLAIYDSLYEE